MFPSLLSFFAKIFMDQKLSMHHLRRRAVDPHRGSSSIIASSSSVAVVKPEEVTLSSNSSTSQSSSTSQLSSTSTDSALPTSFVSANLTSTTELTSSSMSKTGSTTEHSATRTEQSRSFSLSTSERLASSTHTHPTTIVATSTSSTAIPHTTLRSSSKTTLIIPPSTAASTSFQPPSSSISSTSESFVTSLTSSTSTTGHGFLANKGAVAGTFTAVGLIIVGALIAFVFFLKRKSQNYRLSGHSSFLGSFDAQPQMASITPPNAGGVPASPGHSVIDLTAQAPMDPHSYNQFQLYPDFRPYDSRGLSPIQERDPDPPFSITNPPFKRPAAGRGSYQSYQASIDSFYCGPRS